MTTPRKMKTSVVITTKNNGTTIMQCLASLMPYYEQGYISEIVVVDAHSTDGTLEVVRSFPVKLLFDEGTSAYFARDKGWRNSKGELLLFTDADTYLGKGFFPDIYRFFSDDNVGIIGAQEKAITLNRVTRTIGEWWIYQTGNLEGLLSKEPSSWSLFQRLYQRVAWNGEKYLTPAGPCFIIRRICIEAVGGFQSPGSADILMSRSIIERGWKASWWLDAPLYHLPPSSVKQLIRQRYIWGIADALLHRTSTKTYQKFIILISRLGTPVIGLILAVRFKNPLQLLLFPLAYYAWAIGYLTAWLLPIKWTETHGPHL